MDDDVSSAAAAVAAPPVPPAVKVKAPVKSAAKVDCRSVASNLVCTIGCDHPLICFATVLQSNTKQKKEQKRASAENSKGATRMFGVMMAN